MSQIMILLASIYQLPTVFAHLRLKAGIQVLVEENVPQGTLLVSFSPVLSVPPRDIVAAFVRRLVAIESLEMHLHLANVPPDIAPL